MARKIAELSAKRALAQREWEDLIKQRDIETRKKLEIQEKLRRGQVRDLRRATTDLKTHEGKAAELHKQASEKEKRIKDQEREHQKAQEDLHRETAAQRQELERQIRIKEEEIKQREKALEKTLDVPDVGVSRREMEKAFQEHTEKIEELKQELFRLKSQLNRLPR